MRPFRMSHSPSLRLKTLVLLGLMVISGAAGDVLLSKGMKQVGELSAYTPRVLYTFLWDAFTNATVWLGIASLIGYFVCYALVLSWADFSYVLPASALTYVLVPILAFAFLHEQVTLLRWGGVALIFFGVALVGITPPSTTGEQNGTTREAG